MNDKPNFVISEIEFARQQFRRIVELERENADLRATLDAWRADFADLRADNEKLERENALLHGRIVTFGDLNDQQNA
jgi:anti-sigma-K factor RskA